MIKTCKTPSLLTKVLKGRGKFVKKLVYTSKSENHKFASNFKGPFSRGSQTWKKSVISFLRPSLEGTLKKTYIVAFFSESRKTPSLLIGNIDTFLHTKTVKIVPNIQKTGKTPSLLTKKLKGSWFTLFSV